jgi:hypothetical protein
MVMAASIDGRAVLSKQPEGDTSAVQTFDNFDVTTIQLLRKKLSNLFF